MSQAPHVLRFPATIEAFEEAALALRSLLDAQGATGLPRFHVELAFEEIATNIIRYGSPSGDVEVTVVFGEDDIVLTFEDDGVPFDPAGQPLPAVPASIDEARVGGLGLVLVRKISTRLTYTRTAAHRNRLTLAIPAR
jgi:serine/threonine-protein kinase RsbW